MRLKAGALTTAALGCAGSILFTQGGLKAANPTDEIPAILSDYSEYTNSTGRVGVYFQGGPLETSSHPFFMAMGPTGRSCSTCHRPNDGMSLSLSHIRSRYVASDGQDTLFAPVDGANCPNAVERAGGRHDDIDDPENPHSLLLRHGLFRISLPWPPRAEGQPGQPAQPGLPTIVPEFSIEVIKDPSRCNLDPDFGLYSKSPRISVFRRPLMAANLKFVTEVSKQFGWPFDPVTLQKAEIDTATGKIAGGGIMYDGRERTLESQAAGAAINHHQMDDKLTPEQVREIVQFESNIYVAQASDNRAGKLTDEAAEGGPKSVFRRPEATVQFDGHVFPEFDNWQNSKSAYRQSIARGGGIFNRRKFIVRNSAGINDTQATNFSNAFPIGCSNCHDTRGAGHESVAMAWRDIGVGGQHSTAPKADDLPTFRLTCVAGREHPYLGKVIITHDPGRALITGRCADIGKIKGTQIRGLSARAPYFHNGSAKTLEEVVEFYDQRFTIGLTKQDKIDLTNFLKAL